MPLTNPPSQIVDPPCYVGLALLETNVQLFSSQHLNIFSEFHLQILYLITHADGSRGDRVFTGDCLFVCLFIRKIHVGLSQTRLQLGTPNLTHKCFTMTPGNPFILR